MENKNFTATIEVSKPPQDVFNRLTNDVAKWWGGEDLEGSSKKLNDEFIIRHPGAQYSKQKLVEVIPDKKVVWLIKTFTCKEIMNNESGCDMEFSGDDAMDVASQCGKHVASSTDEAHKPMRYLMTNPNHTHEDREKWFKRFQGEWDKKKDK